MAFQGTTTKCTACDKTVYLVDKLTADNRIYHKACFRCHHCKGTLKLGNYNSFEGVLYCRPHFDQLFKLTGSLDKSFEGTPKIVKPEKHVENENASKVSSAFAGTREKCVGCNKTVYPIERVTVNGTAYHKSCFKCSRGGCVISPSTTSRTREGCTASITTSSFSKRRETTANLRTAKRRFHARQQPAQKHLRLDQVPIFRLLAYWSIPL
ncbi:unnamed protein product [Musa textilis]